MSEIASKPVYLVDAYSDPVLVRIEGRASFQNSACLRDFITEMIQRGKAQLRHRFPPLYQHGQHLSRRAGRRGAAPCGSGPPGGT